MTSYRELTALRRPAADHRDLPTAILPAVGRPAPQQEQEPAPDRPAGYVARHRGGRR
ncbi:hypothetical protein [Micromonospora haikouensis]|uniref:hypothetical protein n=1 Tax=Micromonospora haikouensis TaxID=686309 RepID=UPI003D736E2C